jgi:ABC-type Na+ transport system ATPase subunit NatA
MVICAVLLLAVAFSNCLQSLASWLLCTYTGEKLVHDFRGLLLFRAIARAFLKDTPMLILDEPTSAVDTRTVQLVMEALDTLMAGRTAFMIAHRLSTLERCDMVLVLQNGSLHSITGTVNEAERNLLLKPRPRAVETLAPGPILVRSEK